MMSVSDLFSRSIPDSSLLMLSRFSTIALSLSVAVSVSARSGPARVGVLTGERIHERRDRSLDGGERRAQLVGDGVEEHPAQPLRFAGHEVPAVLLREQLALHGKGERPAEHLEGILLVLQPALALRQAGCPAPRPRSPGSAAGCSGTAPCAGCRCTSRRGCGCRSTSAPRRTPSRRSRRSSRERGARSRPPASSRRNTIISASM